MILTMRLSCLYVLVLAGCGRLGFDTVSGAGDAGDAPEALDAPFDPSVPFGTPTIISELSSSSADDDPTLTADMLEIVFDSGRPGSSPGGDLYTSRRATLQSPWSAPTIVVELSSAFDEDTPVISRDGLTITFASDRTGSVGTDLWHASRPDRDSPWSTPVRISELASSSNDEHLSTDAAQVIGMFASNRGGTYALYSVTRASAAVAWSGTTLRTELDSTADEQDPALDPTGTVVVFATTRSGNQDLWIATRPSGLAPFGAPKRIDEVSTASDESDPWISADLRTLVFTRGTSDARDIYISTR
ncbi:hypothetical protein BH11MYX3_BH11MYX3_14130 [soil metagenome]